MRLKNLLKLRREIKSKILCNPYTRMNKIKWHIKLENIELIWSFSDTKYIISIPISAYNTETLVVNSNLNVISLR